MGNDQIRRLDQSSKRLDIDELSFDHRIGDTSQPGDLGRDRPGRLLQAAINADDIADRALIVEGKGDGADFDDLVVAVVETRGLRIENDAEARKPRPSDCRNRSGGQFSQDAIVAALFERPRHVFIGVGAWQRRPPAQWTACLGCRRR